MSKIRILSDAVKQVILSCGWEISKESEVVIEFSAYRQHMDDGIRTGNCFLSFDWMDEVSFETEVCDLKEERGNFRYEDFAFKMKTPLDDIAVLDILQSCGAINYHALPEHKQMIYELLNQIRKNTSLPVRHTSLNFCPVAIS